MLRLKSLAFVIIIAVVCGLALESIVRIAGLAPPLNSATRMFTTDAHLPFKPRPNSHISGRSTTDEFDFDYRHNSLGFRDIEHAVQKQPGSSRIVAIGDSFTYGGGAAFDQTYLAVLERILNDRGTVHPPVEIVKLGIPRFFPEPERALLEHYGMPFSPDLILVAFVPNDVADTALGLDAIGTDEAGRLRTRESLALGRTGIFLFEHSHVFRILLGKYVEYQTARNQPVQWPDIYRANGRHEADWQKIEREYEQMVRIARAARTPVAFVHIPLGPPWTGEHRYPAERLAAWAARQDVVFIDTLPALEAASTAGKRLYYALDGHCTPDGYAVIARALADALTRSGLIP
jgi:lysophospholipase L1-like esterase